jgi:nucleoside-diphosphate-sugar epimerase
LENLVDPIPRPQQNNGAFWKGRCVLVTGHTGFKGSWLTLALQQLGAVVWGYALPPDSERSLFTTLQLDQGSYPDTRQSYTTGLGIFRMAAL